MLTIHGGDRKDAGGASERSRDSSEGGGGLRKGDTLAGRYELERPAGAGGMGAVWVARDRVLDVAVAIKVIRRDARVSGAEARLLTEARAAARLGHPAVVRVLDFGKTEWGDPFMAMELLKGETLASLLAREKRLSPVRAVQLLLPVIDGLSALHAKQIIHRDLKPDNIFLARDEASRVTPKIVDFGIAKLEQRAPFPGITHCGEVLGSPAYMSPEQARGLSGVDQRTDIWSLCVVLYELIAGARPFAAKNYNALLRDIIEGRPPRIADQAACDDDLWMIIEAGLRKEKTERWGSMRELGEALALWLYNRGIKEDICASNIRTAWLEAGLSGVKMELPPSVRPLVALRGKGYAPRIIDVTSMSAALAVTEPQVAFNPPAAPADGLSEQDVIAQMRDMLCTGSTTEDGAQRPSEEGAEEPSAQGGGDEGEPVAEDKVQRASTRTEPEVERPARKVSEPKLVPAKAARPRSRQKTVVITCLAAAMAGACIGLLGLGDDRAPERQAEAAPIGAAFAMDEVARADTKANGETKPAAMVKAPLEKAAGGDEPGAAEASPETESSKGSAEASALQAPSEAKKGEARGSKTRSKGVAPKAPAAPKPGASSFRTRGGDDFNFGF
jgi:serine/threonine-protein kinase